MRGPRVAALTAVVALAACGSSGTPARTTGPSEPATATSASTTATTTVVRTRASAAGSTTATPRGTSAQRAAVAVPPVSKAARRAGLRDIRTIVPDAVLDLRYATTHNFTHVRLYPTDARCLVHKSMAAGLHTAAAALRRQHLRLVFWDCYRPHAVQVRMYQVVSNPNWVAKPGPYARSHEAGRSVDVTLARCVDAQHCLLSMGTGFDNFTPRAYAFATKGVTAKAERNRAILRKAMRAGGLPVYSGEWWHFDGPGADTPRRHLKVAL